MEALILYILLVLLRSRSQRDRGDAGVNDMNVLIAAILHDTIEDTDTTYEELVKNFGKSIADIVNEMVISLRSW